MASVLGKLKVLDAYPKINEDFFTKTLSGGVITVASSIIMVLLFMSELGRSFNCAVHGKRLVLQAASAPNKIHRPALPQRYSCGRRVCTSFQ